MERIFTIVQKCICSLSRTRTSTGFYQPAQKKKNNEGRLDAAGLPFWPLKVGLRLDLGHVHTIFGPRQCACRQVDAVSASIARHRRELRDMYIHYYTHIYNTIQNAIKSRYSYFLFIPLKKERHHFGFWGV